VRTTLVAAICVLSAGCVSKSTYAELESQYAGLEKRCAAELGSCEAEVADLEARVERFEAMAAKRLAVLQELIKDFQPLIDKGILEVTVSDGRVVVAMAAEVLFPSGSASLSKDGQAHLAEIATVLKRRADRDFQVEGHTDNEAISTREFPSNWHLGAARAVVVVRFLVDNGMRPEQLSAASFGAHSPVASNADADGRAQNRRIEIVLVPDHSLLPGYQQLEEKKPPRRARTGQPKGKKPGRKGK